MVIKSGLECKQTRERRGGRVVINVYWNASRHAKMGAPHKREQMQLCPARWGGESMHSPACRWV